MATVKVDFNKLSGILTQLDALNEQCNDLITAINTIRTNFDNDAVWQGEDRTIFCDKLNYFANTFLKGRIYERVKNFDNIVNDYIDEYSEIEDKYKNKNINL